MRLQKTRNMEYNNLELMNYTTNINFVCNILGLFMLLLVLTMILNMQRKIIAHEQELNALKSQILAPASIVAT